MKTTNTIKVFIAEDRDPIAAAYAELIDHQPNLCVIGRAYNGREAVEGCRLLKPDVVLIDVCVPKLDGIATTRLIKAGQPSVKVLVITADHSEEVVFAALAAGADGYCLKTTPPRQLINAIETVHCGAGWLDRRVAETVFREASRGNMAPHARRQTFGLTGRQFEVLEMVVNGKTNQQIAVELGISLETVKSHVRMILDKLMVSDRTQAAVQAFRAGIGRT